MTKITILILLFFSSISSFAQKGKERSNNASSASETVVTEAISDEISINHQVFSKNSNANFYVELKKSNVGVWVDTTKWIVKENKYSTSFKHKSPYFVEANFYYYKSIKTDIEHTDSQISIWNTTFNQLKINKKEYRNVNETNVVFLNFEGNFGSTPETMVGYYKAIQEGTITFNVVIATNNLPKFKDDIMELLNGLIIK